MDDRLEKTIFLCLSFVLDDILFKEGGGGLSFHHLCGFEFLNATCLVIHFLLSLAEQKNEGPFVSPKGCPQLLLTLISYQIRVSNLFIQSKCIKEV